MRRMRRLKIAALGPAGVIVLLGLVGVTYERSASLGSNSLPTAG